MKFFLFGINLELWVFNVFLIKIKVVVCKFRVMVWWIKKFLGLMVKNREFVLLLIVFN